MTGDCWRTLGRSPGLERIPPGRVLGRIGLCGWILVFLTFVSGCFHVPLSSNSTIRDQCQAIPPLEHGEVLVVYGENAAAPEQSAIGTYFTAGCMAAFHGNTIGEFIKTILKVNPQPGRFAVRHLRDLQNEGGGDRAEADGDSILTRLKLSKQKVAMDHLRYAVHVKESFEAQVQVPLYASPFGIASCSNRTVLEANVWDLPTEKFMGSFTVSAEGGFTLFAYLLHLVVFQDTQKDATEKMAGEIVERLTGLKPLENRDP